MPALKIKSMDYLEVPMKYFVELDLPIPPKDVAIQAIYVLKPNRMLQVNKIALSSAMREVLFHIYRPEICFTVLGKLAPFLFSSEIIKKVPLFELGFEHDFKQLSHTLNVVESHVESTLITT